MTKLIFGNIIPNMNKQLSAAIYIILRSLIGLLFRNGVAFGELSNLAKQAYIDVAEQELIESGQKATISMIAISTGLTRKDVSAIKKEKNPDVIHTYQKNRATRVISAWISDPLFINNEGKAKVLEMQGEDTSFEKLVNKYSGDMPYRAMMKELLRTGAIKVVSHNKVALIRSAHIPSEDKEEKYTFLGEDVSSLITTIKHNILETNKKPLFQRKVKYSHVPDEYVDEFKALASQESQNLLIKLNAWLARRSLDKNHRKPNKQKLMKVGLGIYYFEKPSND